MSSCRQIVLEREARGGPNPLACPILMPYGYRCIMTTSTTYKQDRAVGRPSDSPEGDVIESQPSRSEDPESTGIRRLIGRAILDSPITWSLRRARMKHLSRFPLPIRERLMKERQRIPDYYDGPYYDGVEDEKALEDSLTRFERELKANFPERLEDQVAPPPDH